MPKQPWVTTVSFKVFLILSMITMILFSIPIYHYYSIKSFKENSLSAQGKIIAIAKNNKENKIDQSIEHLNQHEYRSLLNYYELSGDSLYPTVEFVDHLGKKHIFRSKQAFSAKKLLRNQVVIRYDPSNPQTPIVDMIIPVYYDPANRQKTMIIMDNFEHHKNDLIWLLSGLFSGALTLGIFLGQMQRRRMDAW